MSHHPEWRNGDLYVLCANLELTVNDDVSKAGELLDTASWLGCTDMARRAEELHPSAVGFPEIARLYAVTGEYQTALDGDLALVGIAADCRRCSTEDASCSTPRRPSTKKATRKAVFLLTARHTMLNNDCGYAPETKLR